MGERDGNQALSGAAAGIEASLNRVLSRPELRTPDLGGTTGTHAFAEAVAAELLRETG
jgi:3-isopropylmalate dehydrogenase